MLLNRSEVRQQTSYIVEFNTTYRFESMLVMNGIITTDLGVQSPIENRCSSVYGDSLHPNLQGTRDLISVTSHKTGRSWGKKTLRKISVHL